MSLPSRHAFALLWVSQAASALGTSVSSLAYPLLLLGTTGSALAAGGAATVAAVVGTAARIPAGSVADRMRSRPVLLACDALRAAVVGGLGLAVLAGPVPVAVVLGFVAVEVAAGAVFGPAEFSLARLLVRAEGRAVAVGRMQPRSQLAGLVGPVVGGALYGLSPALPFLVDAASYLVSFVLVLGLPSPIRPRAGARPGLLAGWSWLRTQPLLLAGGVWTALLGATFRAVGLAILVTARARGATPAEIGLLLTISSAGGLLGALITPAVQRRFRPAAVWRLAAVIDCAAVLALVPITQPLVIGAVGAVAFLLVPATAASLFGALSVRAPDALVGRAQAALTLMTSLPAPLGPLAAGLLLDLAGPSACLIALAAAFGALAVVALVLPAFRRATA